MRSSRTSCLWTNDYFTHEIKINFRSGGAPFRRRHGTAGGGHRLFRAAAWGKDVSVQSHGNDGPKRRAGTRPRHAEYRKADGFGFCAWHRAFAGATVAFDKRLWRHAEGYVADGDCFPVGRPAARRATRQGGGRFSEATGTGRIVRGR